jgi:hypothetical protein
MEKAEERGDKKSATYSSSICIGVGHVFRRCRLERGHVEIHGSHDKRERI